VLLTAAIAQTLNPYSAYKKLFNQRLYTRFLISIAMSSGQNTSSLNADALVGADQDGFNPNKPRSEPLTTSGVRFPPKLGAPHS
jgi:hypothetical protein